MTKVQTQKLNEELEQAVKERTRQLEKAIDELKFEIAERKKANEQKEFEQRDMEALINATDDMLWSLSRDFRLIAANKAFIRRFQDLTGVTLKLGDDLMNPAFFSTDILTFWKEVYIRALSGEAFKKEIYVPALNKFAEGWRETSFKPIYKDETVVALACYSRDVTERKFAEERLRQSEAHLAEAQRLAKVGSWDFDIKADRLIWSEELYNVFGTDKQTFIQTHGSFLDLVDAEDREFALQTNKHTQQTGEPFTIEYHITTPKGEKRVIREHGYGQTDDNGKVVRLFGTAQDITERIKAEEELKQLNEELRSLSSHLQNIQENERATIAREIHDELGQQLTALKMEVAWLNKKLPDDTILKDKANDIISLISEMLTTIKRIAIELRPVILDHLGLIAALEWQSQEFEKRTGINSQFHTDLKDFNADRNLSTQIFRICQEAFTNVARHAQATQIETTIEEKDGSIWLVIKDNGQGFSIDEAKNKNSLGLIGMKERALMFQGELKVESERLKGTHITLKIPLLEADTMQSLSI